MFWGGGKNLDLGSKPGHGREVSVKSHVVRSVSAPAHRPTVRIAPKAALRNLPSTVSSAASDVQVLARFGTLGILQVLGATAITVFFLGMLFNFTGDGAWFAILIGLVIGGLVTVGIWSSAILGLFNLLRRGGRAVWIAGDRLVALDPFHGIMTIGLNEFEEARFEPRLKSGKSSTRRAIVLEKPGGKYKAFGVSHLDTPHDDVIRRIYEAKHKAA